jgi:hypothetical protein
VVRIWEKDPGTVYCLTCPGLVPLAPLMKTADPVATMLESREIIRRVGSWFMRATGIDRLFALR